MISQSEKKDKKIWHKAFRKKEKQKIGSSNLEEHLTSHHGEVSVKNIQNHDNSNFLYFTIAGTAQKYYNHHRDVDNNFQALKLAPFMDNLEESDSLG